MVTNSLLDFFLDGQAEEKLADQCNQFSIQMVTKETMKRGLEAATADETEAVDDADAAPTMADVGLEAPTLDENDISLDIKIQDPEEVEVQACVLEKASELLQDLQADIVCWLSSEENWPPTSIETVLKYEIALQQKLAEMHQKAKDKCMTDELQQAADEFVKDKGFVVDTGIIVEKVLNGPMEKAVRQTVDAVENKIEDLKRELPDSQPDRELVLPAMSFLPEGCVRKWEKSSYFTLKAIAALYAVILACTCTCLVSRSWFECDVGTSTIDFGLDWGLSHNENKIVDYSGDFEKEANIAFSFLLLALIALLPGLVLTVIPVFGLTFKKYTLEHIGQHITCGKKEYDLDLSLDAITPDRFFLIGTITNTLFVVFAALGLCFATQLNVSGCNADAGAALYIMWVMWLVSVNLMFSWVLPFSSRGSVAIWHPQDTQDTQENDRSQENYGAEVVEAQLAEIVDYEESEDSTQKSALQVEAGKADTKETADFNETLESPKKHEPEEPVLAAKKEEPEPVVSVGLSPREKAMVLEEGGWFSPGGTQQL